MKPSHTITLFSILPYPVFQQLRIAVGVSESTAVKISFIYIILQ